MSTSSRSPASRPRVLLVSGPAAGGLKRHVQTLATRLPERGFDAAVAAPAGTGYRAARVSEFELPDRPNAPAVLRSLRQLRQAIRVFQPDLLHVHGAKAALVASWAAGPWLPLAITFHNVWHGGFLTTPLRRAARSAKLRVAVSQAVKESLARHGVCNEAVLILNGVSLAGFTPVHPEAGSAGEPFTVAFVGRLTQEKGVPELLQVIEQLRERPDVRFLMAGDGPLRANVEAAARDSGDRLRYLGLLDDVRPVYQQASVVAIPSWSEGLPMTALEAMACGLPIIASEAGGLPEVVTPGENGLLVPPGNVDALRNAVLRLAEDRQRAADLGAAGRRRVEAEFSEAQMLARVVRSYHELLNGSS